MARTSKKTKHHAPPKAPADDKTRAKRLRPLNEAAAWLLRDSNRLLKKHGKRLDPTTRASLLALRETLEAACTPKPKQRDPDVLEPAIAALDQTLERHLGRFRKSPLREYVEAIGWAIILALLIRAFVFEAFKIPTGSMIPTLRVHDHLFVNKFIYGIKIPFTRIKFLTFRDPKPGEVIVFEYPYDDDPDSTGKDLIKRVIAVAGDRVRLIDNVLHINGEPMYRELLSKETNCGESLQRVRPCPEGQDRWCVYGMGLGEEPADLKHLLGSYDSEASAQAHVRDANGFACAKHLECTAGQRWTAQTRVDLGGDDGLMWAGPLNDANWPPAQFDGRRFSIHAKRYMPPENKNWPEYKIPKGYLLMMGDNRDNSKDGRFFGLVPLDTVKGKAGFVWYAYDRDWWKPNYARIGTLIHDETATGSCP